MQIVGIMDEIVYNGMTEEEISKSTLYSYYYARDVLKGRFELGEKAIFDSGDDKLAIMYLELY